MTNSTPHPRRILFIIGTRPEALKLGPVVQAIAAQPGLDSVLCVTGQHRELLHSALELFNLKPDFDLAVMTARPEPATMLGLLLTHLSPIIKQVQPDWIVAVGDTMSVLSASLVAALERVRFAHVEAGLRSHDKREPFPEEINRRLTAVMADLHLAPTPQARENLLNEGVPDADIVVTGNPILDTLRIFSARPEPVSLKGLWRQLRPKSAATGKTPRLIVVTFHRRENLGEPISAICAALREIADRGAGTIKILCIVHPNPIVREPARRDLANHPHIVLSDSLPYPAMIAVLKRATLILTDSGGIQEEAPALHIPVLVLRHRTERPEGIAAGIAGLTGTSRAEIVRNVQLLLDDSEAYRRRSHGFDGYGDGHAVQRIVAALLRR